jgi:hypothetical protein
MAMRWWAHVPKWRVFLDSYDVLKNLNTKFERDQYQLLITQFGEENCVYFWSSMRAPHQHS